MQSLDRTPRRARATFALFFVAFGLAAASGAAPLGLSADQQHRLAAGEVVVLDTLPPGASKSAGGGRGVASCGPPRSACGPCSSTIVVIRDITRGWSAPSWW